MGNDVRAEINPYSPAPSSPPPVLTGRDADLREIMRSLRDTAGGKAHNANVFIGERGMGKTSMLLAVKEMAHEKNAIVLHAEMSKTKTLRELFDSTGGFSQAQRDARAWLNNAARGLGGAVAKAARFSIESGGVEMGSVGLNPQAEDRGFIAELNDLNSMARKRGRFLAMTVDEIQAGSPAELSDLTAYLAHASANGMPVAFFAAGLPETQRFVRTEVKTYTERWLFRPIDLLSRDAAREAIERPARENGVHIDADALDLLVQEAGGYPHALQIFAYEAWEERSADSRITLADAERAIPNGHDKMKNVYEGRLNDLAARECAFVVALADATNRDRRIVPIGEVAHRMGAKSSAHIGSLRERLEAKDVIRSPHTGVVEFRIPGMDTYIRDRREQFVERSSSRFSPLLQIGQRVALQHDGADGRAIALAGARAAGHDRAGGRAD